MGRPSYSSDVEELVEAPEGASSESGIRPSAKLPPLPPAARIPVEAQALHARDVRLNRLPNPTPAAREVVFDDVVTTRRSLPSLPAPLAQLGRYAVLGRLAVGGMAEIYLAREGIESGGQRHAAIKVLRNRKADAADSEYFEELFLREGRTASQLVHPNICHVYEFGKAGGHFYIAMEWIDGVSLFQLCSKLAEKGQRLPVTIAVSIAAQVAFALDYAHNARDARRKPLAVVHRDVNPYNIMLRHDGGVKLLDFGVAQVADPQEDTRTDTVKGKLGYMAPEQAKQEALDARADIFALGVCLHEMLTGKRLYRRENMRETMAALLHEPPPSVRKTVPSIPEQLDLIVQRALAKNPDERFASAGELQAALESYLAKSGEVVSSRRLAQLMESAYPDAQTRAPALYTGEEVVARLTPLGESQHLSALPVAKPTAETSRVRAWLPWMLVIVAAVIAAAGWTSFLRTPNEPEAPVVQKATPTPAVPEPAPAVMAPVPEQNAVDTASVPGEELEEGSTAPDSKVGRNVRRRAAPRFVADPGF